MQTFFDNSTSIRAHSGTNAKCKLRFILRRQRAELDGETCCSRVATGAKLDPFAPLAEISNSKTELESLRHKDLRARSQKPLAQNPPNREV
jgi:hypothetical protein